jgi:hypothetical protein
MVRSMKKELVPGNLLEGNSLWSQVVGLARPVQGLPVDGLLPG